MSWGDPELVARYEAGEHLRQLAAAYGCSHETIRQRLIRAGAALRLRAQPHGGRRRKRTPLSDELLADLSQWPQGAGIADLVEWYGESRTAIIAALGALIAEGQIVVHLRKPSP